MDKIETYDGVIEFLYEQLPIYQRDGQVAYKANLDNIVKFDDQIGKKHYQFKTIHVAGTNGKGSVSHMLSSILQSEGYKTGLYTSPHLKDFRERIRIDGKMIPKKDIIDFVNNNHNIIEKIEPSFFELTVAIAFEYFAKGNVDIAIIETGLGGRLDSTNIIEPEVSIITNIGYDHTQFLGNTLSEIAGEKAGIIKENIPVIIGESHPETQDVFISSAKNKNSEIYFADKELKIDYALRTIDSKQQFNVLKNDKVFFNELQIDLLGVYQQKNVITCLQSIEILRKNLTVSDEAIYSGLKSVIPNTNLQGKWQIIGNKPLIVCDTGHNKEGLLEVFKQIKETSYKNLHIVIGFVKDKDISPIIQILPKDAEYYITRASIPRALDENIILEKFQDQHLNSKSFKTVEMAVVEAKNNAEDNDLIFIGGSTFVVAEAL